jgi:hypothetical protein
VHDYKDWGLKNIPQVDKEMIFLKGVKGKDQDNDNMLHMRQSLK